MTTRYHETTHALAADFTKAFLDALWRENDMTVSQLYRYVINSGAPRWYVSHANAMRVLSSDCGKNALNYRKRGLYAHLEKAVKKIIDDGLADSLSHAVAIAIESPAPSFFISERTARRIISRRRTPAHI